MMDWQRKRHPEDVPTPTAVAVADFCRRAKAPATPALVREALALLGDDDDFRVREITDAEPAARPLGPFAVVDVVRGTAPTLAAQRQETGYYDVVRSFVEERARTAPAEEPRPSPERVVPFPVVEAPRPAEAEAEPASTSRRKKKGPSVSEKIQPKKRSTQERPARAVGTAAPPATSFLPRRQLPAPRGRFTVVDPARASIHALLKPDGRDPLEALVAQVPHRVALWRTLSQGYTGRSGKPLTLGDVEGLLDKHRLRENLEVKEREAILGALVEQRGAFGKAAKALGMRDAELTHLLKSLRIAREAEKIRERHAREALSSQNLGLRLQLLFQTRYLQDLGIERAFKERIERDARLLVDEALEESLSLPDRIALLARRHAVNADALRRALDALDLLSALSASAKE